jgi:hypothetical protein
MLCGHSYNIIFAGYSYDKNHWIDVGYNRDFASCYPDRGAHLISASIIGTIENQKVINGIKISYFRDHLAGLQLYFLKLGLSAEAFTNYKKVDSLIRPEIRVGDNMFFSKFLTRLQFCYGYNIFLSDNNTIERGRHEVSINVRLFIKGWVN